MVALGFKTAKAKQTSGDHRHYEKGDRIVQVDMGEKKGFATPGMKLIINATRYDRVTFYRATKRTAKKINLNELTDAEKATLDD